MRLSVFQSTLLAAVALLAGLALRPVLSPTPARAAGYANYAVETPSYVGEMENILNRRASEGWEFKQAVWTDVSRAPYLIFGR